MAEKAANLAIRTIIHKDYASYPPELLVELKGASGIIWALGISRRGIQGSEWGEGREFMYVSGEGATPSPGRFTPQFGKVKAEAETETALLALHKTHPQLWPYNARARAVDPSGHKEVVEAGTWERKGAMSKIGDAVLMPAIRGLYKGMHSPTPELGRALMKLAMGDGAPIAAGKGLDEEGRTLSNVALRRIIGL